ncbi:hypothetical protein SASPL_110897 [Salvia splendens]|uniref:DNA helicase n=1 Tax=Salvia splendens TaxID=180675 RepID=A0A8X8Y718_SALSN|nr:hypothetical protein SASPL_110897 [Salvia splendens]
MAGDDDSFSSGGDGAANAILPSTPDSPTSAGFNTDQLQFNTIQSYTDEDDKASVIPEIGLSGDGRAGPIRQYEGLGIDDSLEGERDLDQIMGIDDSLELDAKEACVSQRKLPQLLHDQDSDDESYRPSKRTRADLRPPATPENDDPYDDEENDEPENAMYRVQGTLREWVTRDEVRRFIGKKFKGFLLAYIKPRSENEDFEYLRQINEMISVNKCSHETDYTQFIFAHPNIAIWLADAPQSVLEIMEEVANKLIRNIRQIHLNTMIRIGGVVTRRSGVFSQLLQVKYEWSSSGAFCPELMFRGKGGFVSRIAKSIAPFIYGYEDIKTAIALAMFGGQEKNVEGKYHLRGAINVLLLGDPEIAKYVEKTGQRAVYTTGASAVGLTAAVYKDPVTREVSIHEAMEQQNINISKAGIVTSLQARCSVIAAANPIGYDSLKTFSQNVELTDPIVSRFDILCVVNDVVDPVTDEMLTQFLVDSHYNSHPKGSKFDHRNDSQDENQAVFLSLQIIPQEMLKKCLTYVKLNIYPKSHDADLNNLTQVYAELRRESSNGQRVSIAVRRIKSMIRMSKAHARMHLRSHVIQEDVDMAIQVLLDSFISTQKFGVQKALQKVLMDQVSINHLLPS